MTLAFLQTIARIPSAGTPAGTPGPLLYGLVRQIRPDTILEVGAWQGHSTLWLAQGCKDNCVGRVYAVDNWSLAGGHPDALRAVADAAGLSTYIVPVNGDSLSVEWPKTIDFAFIDGNHSRRYCEAEIARAIERGAKTIVVHDTTSWWGPRGWLRDVGRSHRFRQFDVLEIGAGDGLAILHAGWAAQPVGFGEDAYPEGRIG